MKLLEVTEVRSVNSTRKEMEAELRKVTSELNRTIYTSFLEGFCRHDSKTDFCIYLVHKADTLEKSGSALAQQLVSRLNGFGMSIKNYGLRLMANDCPVSK